MARRSGDYPPPGSFREPAEFRDRLAELGCELPCDDAPLSAPDSPLAAPLATPLGRLENRFAVQPMEGWDGTEDGRPSELTRRRWERFGESGAALVWGGEAVAVLHEGRANPHQLRIGADTSDDLAALRTALIASHRCEHPGTPDPVVGLQLTHSGRWSCPDRHGARAPRIAYRHPYLDRRLGDRAPIHLLEDDDLRRIRDAWVDGARRAAAAGFDFVDVKHCHGYLGHELLSARDRPGPYGGSLEGRSRFLFECIDGIRAAAPGLGIGVRLSVFDAQPYRPRSSDGVGEPEEVETPYRWGFGLDAADPARVDLDEPAALVGRLAAAGVWAVNVTAGCPYYAPHIQRPALYPPSDGYLPPEDPLAGVDRLFRAAREIKRRVPGIVVIASGATYLQEFLPHVAQAAVRAGWFDLVGLGRSMLSYPRLPADLLAGARLDRKRLCRTFSDCTTGPRLGVPSGCYPLDAFYRSRHEAAELRRGRDGTR